MRSQEQLEATQLKMLSLTPDVFNLERRGAAKRFERKGAYEWSLKVEAE